ncbi:MAG: hypothetical protein ACE5J3_10360, partial [Methanosarcinales archaeon]
MKSVVSVLQVVLIFAIAVSLIILASPWVYSSLKKSFELSEFQTIRGQFELCNDKIVETARTGTKNSCVFSISKGILSIESDGIYYKLTSSAEICDEHDWVEINPDKHLWQSCFITDSMRTYQMKWSSPDEIIFQSSIGSGNIIEITRFSINETSTT